MGLGSPHCLTSPACLPPAVQATPRLFLAAATGQLFPSITLTTTRPLPGTFEPSDLLKIVLYNARVTGVTQVAEPRGGNPLSEVSFTYQRARVTYVPILPDGKVDLPVDACWNMVQNVKC